MEVQEEAITMEVEAMTTKEEDYDDDDHHQPTRAAQMMIKGKRTKRQRPQSPIPFLQVPTVNSSSATGDCGGGLGLDPPANMSPPANSWDFPATCSATEEEEDMANCLILLAQGQSREPPPPPVQDDNRNNNNAVAGVYNCKVPARSSSKLGVYVYECKTCSRTFPSFQALGGHRASHKKPKLAAAAEEKRRLQQRSAEKEYFGQFKSSNVNTPHSLSLQLSSRAMHACNNNNNNHNNNRSKLHECSICGAEFSSGQALGGHMRRHRGMAPPINAAASATTLSLMSPMALDDHQTVEELITISNDNKNDDYKKDSSNINGVNGGAGGLSLSLDLNLPAPDDERETNKFGFPSKQQPEQSHLVFSTPTLVDCQH